MHVRERFAALRLLVLDVDGVFTDGRFTLDETGHELKTFHTQDGYGLRRLLEAGIEIAVISGRNSGAVSRRMAELGVAHVRQGCRDKVPEVEAIARALDITLTDVGYVGDDIPDLDAMRACGLAIAVANAVEAVRTEADYVTTKTGGHGAIREIADTILIAREERPSR